MFELKFSTGNAAFEGDEYRQEIARVLRGLASDIENGSTFDGPLRDANGNRIGAWSMPENDE